MKAICVLYGEKEDIDKIAMAAGGNHCVVLEAAVDLPNADQMTLEKELKMAFQIAQSALVRAIDQAGERELLPTGR